MDGSSNRECDKPASSRADRLAEGASNSVADEFGTDWIAPVVRPGPPRTGLASDFKFGPP